MTIPFPQLQTEADLVIKNDDDVPLLFSGFISVDELTGRITVALNVQRVMGCLDTAERLSNLMKPKLTTSKRKKKGGTDGD